jgi:SepF-like predicted cell division protein (DUF552 family)
MELEFEYSDEYLKSLEGLTEEQRLLELEELNKSILLSKQSMYNRRIKEIRKKRDELLVKSDYYFSVPDIKITDDKREKLLKYRQELRDFPDKIKGDILYIDDKEINIIITLEEVIFQYLPKLD